MVIIMIGSSCDSNLWSTRQSLIQVTSTIPMSRGWTTPSSSCCWTTPLLSSQSLDPYGVFRVFCCPHRKIVEWGIHIVGFWTRWFHRVQVASKQCMMGIWAPPRGLVVGPCGPPFSFLVAFPVEFFISWSSIYRKNDVVERLGPEGPCCVWWHPEKRLLVPSWRVADGPCAWWITSPLGTPRGRYDEYSS
jgi:hypothetical protein